MMKKRMEKKARMYRLVGIYYAYWAREWDVDFLPIVDKVKALGFDQLELYAAVLESKASSYRLAVRERAEKAGIALSYGMGMDKDYDLSSMDEEV
jgi:D-psicose/D-tagatose/L-ribulose 3-epimerase